MSLIKGVYNVRAPLSQIVNGYTFTGENRNVGLSPSDEFMLDLTCDDIPRPNNTDISLVSNNKLFIRKVKLITNGARGLLPSVNFSRAGTLFINARSANDITSDNLGGFLFSVDNFNEWQDVSIEFLPEKKNENYYLSVNNFYSRIWFDDYNIQDAYIGQTFNLFLEMMIDTAGVFDHDGGIV